MGIDISVWNSELAKQEISKRFRNASDARKYHENRWMRNERIVYSTSLVGMHLSNTGTSLELDYTNGLPDVDGSDADVNVSYVFKNFRFIHAQMSANPPSVAMRPTSSDQEDHRKADAADRLVRWAMRQYSMQEKVDQFNLHALLYGTGVMKHVWDSSKGDIIGFDEETGEVELEGDISITIPFIWNIFIDPDAKSWDEIRYMIERIYMDYDEACRRWPEHKDLLKQARVSQNNTGANKADRSSYLEDNHYNSVELLEYWEPGLPTNGYLGRYCISTCDGQLLEEPRISPHRFRQAGAVARVESLDRPDEVKEVMIEKLPEKAKLPYTILTDIDIPNCVWGRSSVEYASQLQENLARLDTSTLDNIQAHSSPRMVVNSTAEITDEDFSNSPWVVTKIESNQPPYYVSPPSMMPEMTSARQNYIQGIDDVMGVNESMFGQQSREQSGASMQYATNQGNMVRRRLFNKYVLAVESMYKAILNLIRKHWSVSRTIHVLGKEKALEAIDIKGADIDGGYDVVGEYGVTLSLDPITRREEILTMQPLFEKAGIPARKALELLKLNELEGMYDRLALAGNRQKEIFDMMIATSSYIAPKKFRDHENMAAWALDYFMSSEFNALPENLQALCERHIEERMALAAQEQLASTSGPTAPVAAEPAPEMPVPTAPNAGL